jgi:hypothetical protein
MPKRKEAKKLSAFLQNFQIDEKMTAFRQCFFDSFFPETMVRFAGRRS